MKLLQKFDTTFMRHSVYMKMISALYAVRSMFEIKYRLTNEKQCDTCI